METEGLNIPQNVLESALDKYVENFNRAVKLFLERGLYATNFYFDYEHAQSLLLLSLHHEVKYRGEFVNSYDTAKEILAELEEINPAKKEDKNI